MAAIAPAKKVARTVTRNNIVCQLITERRHRPPPKPRSIDARPNPLASVPIDEVLRTLMSCTVWHERTWICLTDQRWVALILLTMETYAGCAFDSGKNGMWLVDTSTCLIIKLIGATTIR